MDPVSELFDRMDDWRHLPSYQLERRADLVFSLYLPEMLERKLGFRIKPDLVPELPIRIGTIYPNIPINRSFKVDYLAISEDGDKAVLVELKTEGRSRRTKQDDYLVAAREAGLPALLEGLLDILRATTAKRKYFCLLNRLERLGLLHIPDAVREIMKQPALHGVNEASHDVEITCPVAELIIAYIQPNGHGNDVISFDDFRSVVGMHDDPFSRRFARSLSEWAQVEAGERNGP